MPPGEFESRLECDARAARAMMFSTRAATISGTSGRS
jgi:hypothetical protein